ncbi:mitochondrial pyruvate carrier 2 [Biomphalaria glabrata]|uniref:Mitochondrial pyruvate carrier n=1 Tax=Biomphalaria glabrata TaxID=6526 RepID=A0A2C9KLF8_BIOGL|nr:mitochondrial pyruvate carrier 2-like [Biomphalaria glabrata]
MVRLMPTFATRFYEFLIRSADPKIPPKLRPLWVHPAGPKTIFFWSPFAKWLLVIAGIGDISRPAEKLSLRQSSALCLTGFIWSRYSLVIIPKNWSLFAVNFFTGLTGTMQLSRIAHFNYVTKPQRDAEASERLHKKYLAAQENLPL